MKFDLSNVIVSLFVFLLLFPACSDDASGDQDSTSCPDSGGQSSSNNISGDGIGDEDGSCPELEPKDTIEDRDGDVIPPIKTFSVDYFGGVMIVGEDPFFWRLTPFSLVSNKVSSAIPPIEVEFIEQGIQAGFADPRPSMNLDLQNWKVTAHVQSTEGGPLSLTLSSERDPERGQLQLEINSENGGLHVDLSFLPGTHDARRIAFNWSDSGGALLGSGMRLDKVNGRGLQRPLFLAEDQNEALGNNGAFFPVPMILNPRGYMIFIDSDRPGVFDLEAERQGVLGARFDARALDIWFWSSPNPLGLLNHYVNETGLPNPPPTWALAPQLWRPNTTQQQLIEDAEILRALKLPVGGLWIDDPWSNAYNDLNFNPAQFPDPEGLFADLKSKGFQSVLWSNPHLNTSDDSDIGEGWSSAQTLFDEAATEGFLVTDSKGESLQLPWRDERLGGLIDFTNPEARAWWGERLIPLIEAGVSGFRLDIGTLVSVVPTIWADGYHFANGETESTMHRRHANAFHEAFAEVLGGQGLLMGREGAYGAQKTLQAVWPPPLRGDFSAHSPGRVGGLRAALTAGLSLAVSGYPFYAPELGGSIGEPPTQEAFLRWVALGIFTPIMQIGGDRSARMPWEAPFNEETLERYKRLTQLRIELSYYLERQVELAATQGTPIMRPYYLAFPNKNAEELTEEQFLFGPDLIIAPVLDEGAQTQDVLIPEGLWRDWYTGGLALGPTSVQVSAPLDRVPIFAKDGSIIPLRLSSIQTLSETTDPNVVGLDDVRGTMVVRVVGYTDNDLIFHDGALFDLEYQPATQVTTVKFIPGEEVERLVVEFIAPNANKVTCEGQELEEDPSVALTKIEETQGFAFRNVGHRTYLRIPSEGTCELTWINAP